MQWIRIAAILGGLAVVIGAFGAHGLKDRLASTGYAQQFETGVHYHMSHALALLGLGVLVLVRGHGASGLNLAGWCFVLGIVLFSGSLYALGLSGTRWLGAITPFGGLFLIVGWGALAWSTFKS